MLRLWREKFNFFGDKTWIKVYNPFLAHLRFSDRLSSLRLFVNFSHLQILLQNHWVNFNQIWHKGDLNLYKWKGHAIFQGT